MVIAFHAAAAVRRCTDGATARVQCSCSYAGETPHAIGFKDGTINPKPPFAAVWVTDEGPAWLRNGSYLVTRRIRISLEHWDRTETDFQEEVMGRRKYSGAPLGGQNEFDPLALDAMDQDGNPLIAENAHVPRPPRPVAPGPASAYNGVNFAARR
jgi:deferrochelatase/peroxidase EfeB